MILKEKTIRFVIKSILNENDSGKITNLIAIAINAGYAICNFKFSDVTLVCLYDPTLMLNILTLHIKNKKPLSISSDRLFNITDDTNVIIAGISFTDNIIDGPCNGGQMIKNSASISKTKMGPVVYEYALSIAKTGLFPDRGSVSPEAKKVWDKYFKRKDVNKKSFDDINNPKTPDPQDDCFMYNIQGNESLDQTYSIDNINSNFSELLSNHAKCIQQIRKLFESNSISNFDSIIKKQLYSGFSKLFDNEYKY